MEFSGIFVAEKIHFLSPSVLHRNVLRGTLFQKCASHNEGTQVCLSGYIVPLCLSALPNYIWLQHQFFIDFIIFASIMQIIDMKQSVKAQHER